MARRPTDWSPIAETDPVPGDPEAVRDEADRLKKIAETLERQVSKLRRLGKDENIKGKYADSLREEAEKLADRFDKTKGRYKKVQGHLRTWADELEYAQTESKKALDKAKADEKNEDVVDEAKKQLTKAINHRYTHALSTRRRILDAIDDEVEDSLWDDTIGWVKEHADGLKLFIDVLSWIGTIAAIVAIFIPGLNLLVLGLGLAVVLGRFLLVKAGKSTWMDLAFDAFGLVTMGAGGLALKGLRAANTATRAASTVSRTAKLKNALAATKSIRNQLANRLASATDDAAAAAVRAEMTALRKGIAGRIGKVSHELPQPSKLSKVLHLGDDELAALGQNIRSNVSRFGDGVPTGTKLGGGAAYGTALAATYGGALVDWGDKMLGDNDTLNAVSDGLGIPHKPSADWYNDFKANHGVTQASSAWN
ncbi:putative T7SS-secreted protein [Streptomyces sp. enrichment culture]|uniref:putative T7SS-secreted protein n=1 Tax=Streptomyces sp. enrichment culture TaxID=1795815 RepID=UPI003F574439